MSYLLVFLLEFAFFFFLSRTFSMTLHRLFAKITGNRNIAIRLFHLLLLPGVVIHELAHLIVAEVMLVRTGGLSFSLEQEEDRVVMGSVGIESTDPVRKAIIGFAPVFVGILLIGFFVFYFLSENSPLNFPWNFALVFFVVFQIGNTMFSSRRDLEGTIQLLFVITMLIIAGYFLGFRLPEWFINFLNSDQFGKIVEKGIWVLTFPIAGDLLILSAIKILRVFESS